MSVDPARPAVAARPADAARPTNAARPVDATKYFYANKSINAAKPVNAARSFPGNDHLPTPIPQLDGEALEPDPEPVLQVRRRQYGGGTGDRVKGQKDIDPTLCVKCDIPVYIDIKTNSKKVLL